MSEEHKMEYFDDCPICQAMKRAEEQGRTLSLSELKTAFKAAEEQGTVVSGEWFDHESKKE